MAEVENKIMAPTEGSTLRIFYENDTTKLGESLPLTITVLLSMDPDFGAINVGASVEIIDGPFTFDNDETTLEYDTAFLKKNGDEIDLRPQVVIENKASQNVESISLVVRTWNILSPEDKGIDGVRLDVRLEKKN